jgi:tetratricopeptide (TPR) repeat protein
VAYADSFGLGLAQDSKAIVTQDPRLRAATSENLGLILTKNYWWPKAGDGLYRPVTTASFLLNYAVLGNGPNPAGYHWIDFLLHAINACLVYQLALLIFRRGWPALCAAALWAVHPICTEAVDNIVGRADLLAAMSVLGGLLLYRRALAFEGRRRTLAALALFAIATAGVFAKENAAVLLGLMLLWDVAFDRAGLRRDFRRRSPLYGAVAASLVLLVLARHLVLGALPVAQPVYVDNMIRAAGSWTARFTALKTIGLDLWLLVWPLRLSSDRSFDQIPLAGPADLTAWLAFLAIVAILAVAAVRFRRDPLWFWLAGLFGIALLPTANLLFPIGALMAERFLYLPSVAFAIALAAAADRIAPRRLATGAVILLGLLYTGRTLARNLDWKDNLSLGTADTVTAPRSFRLHDLLARALFDQDPQRNLDSAIAEQEKAWAILSPLPPAISSEMPPMFLGIYYDMKAASLGPANPQSRAWYEKSAAVLWRARDISRAAGKAYDDTQRAQGRPLTARSGFPQLYLGLANTDLNLGRFAEAAEACRYAAGLDPAALDAYDGMALAYLGLNQPERAAVALLEKAQMDDFQPATLAALRDVYARIPEGACAVDLSGGAPALNPQCPRLAADFCQAAADLQAIYRDARQPDGARQLARWAAKRYGCPAVR